MANGSARRHQQPQEIKWIEMECSQTTAAESAWAFDMRGQMGVSLVAFGACSMQRRPN